MRKFQASKQRGGVLRALLFVSLSLMLGLSLLLVVGAWFFGMHGAPLAAELAQKALLGQLTIAKAEGGLFGPLTVTDLQFENNGVKINIDRLYFDWQPAQLWSGALVIRKLEVGSVEIVLKPTRPTAAKPLITRLPLALHLDHIKVAQLNFTPVSGQRQSLTDLAFTGSWHHTRIVIDSLKARHETTGPVVIQGAIVLTPQQLNFEALQIDGPGHAQLDGKLGLQTAATALSLQLRDARWPLQGVPQAQAKQLKVTVDGVLATAARKIRLSAVGQLRTAGLADAAETSLGFNLVAAAQLNAGDANIEQFDLTSTDGAGRLSAKGAINWQPALTAELEATLQKFNPGLLLRDWPGQLNGRIQAHTEIGQGAAPGVRFSVKLADSKLRGYPLSLDANGVAAKFDTVMQLTLDSLLLSSGSARLSVRGKLLPQMDAQAVLAAADLRPLLPALFGSAQLKIAAQGEPQAPRIQASGQVKNLSAKGVLVSAANLKVDIDPKHDSQAQLRAVGVSVAGRALTSLSLDAHGRAEKHRVIVALKLAQPVTEASWIFDGSADLKLRRWRGTLSASELLPPIGPRWTLTEPAVLELDAARQLLQRACWHAARSSVCVDGSNQPSSQTLKLQVQQLNLAAFQALLPKGWVLQTVLDAVGDIALEGGNVTQLHADFSTGVGQLSGPNIPTIQLQSGQYRVLQEAGEWLAKVDLVTDRAGLHASARVATTGPTLTERALVGAVQLSVPDLAWLSPLVPGVTDLQGAVDGAFQLGGTVGAPQLNGGLSLSGGSAKVTAVGITLTEVTASLRGGFGTPLLINASARSGDGVLKIDGNADTSLAPIAVQLSLRGDQLQVADLPDARIWLSPDLVFEQGSAGLKLTGTVDVSRADITPRKLSVGAVGTSRDQVIVGSQAPAEKTLPLTATVLVRLGDQVSFEGFGLKARLEGEVTAFDEPGAGGTRGRGELRLVDGRYQAYGQDLSLQTGRLIFSGGPITEPTIDLRANRQPREDITVGVHVRGTLKQPSFDLSSTPVMPREQQLGWLLLGRPIDSGNGEQLQASAAMLSLGLLGGDKLAQGLGKNLGLDDISLGSQPGEASDQARLTVGKYLSPKLYISYGVGLFQNANVVRLLYDIGHGFKLRTESGTYTGGDLLYRVEH